VAGGLTIAGMVAAGAVMIGSAATIVGTITGNKNLVKYGGIVAAVGGLGMGILGATGSLTSSASQAAADTAGQAVNSIASTTTDVAASGAANAASLSGANIATPVIDAAGTTASLAAPAANVAAAVPTGVLAPPASTAGATNLPPPVNQAVNTNVNSAATGDPNVAAAYNPNTMVRVDPNTLPLNNVNLPQVNASQGGYFDRFGKWVRENRDLARIGSQVAAGVAGAIPNETTRAQAEAMRQNAGLTLQQRRDAAQRAAWREGRAWDGKI
jgi:hypothetical protein